MGRPVRLQHRLHRSGSRLADGCSGGDSQEGAAGRSPEPDEDCEADCQSGQLSTDRGRSGERRAATGVAGEEGGIPGQETRLRREGAGQGDHR